MIKCIMNQSYKGPLEWIIVDDGDDKIYDLVKDISFVKYYPVDKMSIGEKRNLMHKYTKGEIIIYIDDDDYYPPQRIEHTIESLKSTLICGSSIMYMYFTNLEKIYKFGPYGENHATAATFGFRRNLLNKTSYNNNDKTGEEKFFLKKWSIPLTQMDPKKTILVIAHNSNTVDKNKILLTSCVEETNYTLEDFIEDPEIISFYRNINEKII
uniref:Glycosyltransferase 2-like domain-containing protein n=1 Tax=viral metagenome TaxID=1070528 RepID=A0A6C0HRP5_9ZZZZ